MTIPLAGVLSPLELLVVLAVVAAIGGRWMPERLRRPVTIVALGSVVVLTGVVLLTGLRWQLLPVLAAVVLVLPGAIMRIRRPSRSPHRARRVLGTLGAVALLGITSTGPAAAAAFPVPQFPEPPGPHDVGTTVVEWTDENRPEPATDDPGDAREVIVQFWYPAEAAGAPGPYFGRTAEESRLVADGIASYLGLPAWPLHDAAGANGPGAVSAPVAAGTFPVVLFSPGLGGVRTQNSAWAADLASRGYIVAALDHPYDSSVVVFSDGRVIGTRVAATGDDERDDELAAGWTATRSGDLGFALTRLTDTPPSLLTGHLDLDRVAATGHSLGGAAALHLAARDDRIDAVIDIDGFPRDPDGESFDAPVLALVAGVGADPDYIPALDAALANGGDPSLRVRVPGTEHLTFTDAPIYLPPIPFLVGTLGRYGGHEHTAGATAAFLEAVLGEEPTEELAQRLAVWGEVTEY